MNENFESQSQREQIEPIRRTEYFLWKWFNWNVIFAAASKRLNFDRILAILLFVVSTAMAIVLYFAGTERPCLTYYVGPKHPLGLKGPHSVEIQVWNNGTAPIKGNDVQNGGDVVKRLTIGLLDGTPAAGLNIFTTDNNEDVSSIYGSKPLYLSLGTNHFEYVFAMHWKVLQDGDGFKVQLSYAGNSNAPIIVDCAIVGQKHMVQYNRFRSDIVLLSLIGGIPFLLLYKKYSSHTLKLAFFLAIGVFCGTASLIIAVQYYTGCYNKPFLKPFLYANPAVNGQLDKSDVLASDLGFGGSVSLNAQLVGFGISLIIALVILSAIIFRTLECATDKAAWIVKLRVHKKLLVCILYVILWEGVSFLVHYRLITPLLFRLNPPFGL